MAQETIKLEIIEWLAKLDNDEIIDYLKIVKDSNSADCVEEDLPGSVIAGIEKGLRDIDEGRVVSHEEVKKRYGL